MEIWHHERFTRYWSLSPITEFYIELLVRSFNVRIGSTLSDTFEQEQGVPQGSIIYLLYLISKLITLLNVLMTLTL